MRKSFSSARLGKPPLRREKQGSLHEPKKSDLQNEASMPKVLSSFKNIKVVGLHIEDQEELV